MFVKGGKDRKLPVVRVSGQLCDCLAVAGRELRDSVRNDGIQRPLRAEKQSDERVLRSSLSLLALIRVRH
jgi:hypothetical protein